MQPKQSLISKVRDVLPSSTVPVLTLPICMGFAGSETLLKCPEPCSGLNSLNPKPCWYYTTMYDVQCLLQVLGLS